MKRRSGSLLLLGLVTALAIGGLLHLFRLRWAIGDVYPPYSSLRSDPLGTKVLLTAVSELGDRGVSGAPSVVRSTAPLANLDADSGTTVLVAGIRAFARLPADPRLEQELNRLLTQSARVVVTVAPMTREPLSVLFSEPGDRSDAEPREVEKEGESSGETTTEGGAAGGEQPPAGPGGAEEETASESDPGDDVPESTWGVELGFLELPRDESGRFHAVTVDPVAGEHLPSTLEWRSALVFSELAPQWQVHYARDEHPVLVSRRLAGGTLVLATDSFFLSNEGLHRAPATPLLAWLLGDCERLVVDEAHLGVRDPGGVVVLARRYGLGGFAVGLVLVAVLLVWQAAAPFLPPLPARPSASLAAAVAGRGSAEGLVTLLRRGVPRSRLLATCIDEWARHSPQRRHAVGSLCDIAAQAPDPVTGYRRLARHLGERRERPVGAPGQKRPVGAPDGERPVGAPDGKRPVGAPNEKAPVGAPDEEAPVGGPHDREV